MAKQSKRKGIANQSDILYPTVRGGGGKVAQRNGQGNRFGLLKGDLTRRASQVQANSTSGGPKLKTSLFSDFGYGGAYVSPADLMDIRRQVYNQQNMDMDQRQQMGLDQMKGGMNRSRSLYADAVGALNSGNSAAMGHLNDSMAETNNFGQQAYGRIEQDALKRRSASDSSLMNRGLYNSTVVDAQNLGNDRITNDAKLGVDEAKSGLRMGVNNSMAGLASSGGAALAGQANSQNATEQGINSNIANYYMARSPLDPTAGMVGQVAPKKPSILGSIAGAMGGSLLGAASGGIGMGIGNAVGSAVGNLFGSSSGATSAVPNAANAGTYSPSSWIGG